jgi:hypothetical protein
VTGAAPAATTLERRAERWIAPYWNARHLLNTREWLVRLEPEADEPLRLAALVHDCERMIPGGPRVVPSDPPDDERYLRAHSERSAHVAADWLRETGATARVVEDVAELVRLHEVGGTARADVLQAADSISFLDVNDEVVLGWVADGRATRAQARAKLDYMLQRIRIEPARELAWPLHARVAARLEEQAA